ncbi:MAG TPA: sugar phosphate isomerase/epimerase family protein [Bryobacteraceae bacterium]|nr:sugar phosphate isomerase/epimerase family protein [Bryobacteraceae bacterium]
MRRREFLLGAGVVPLAAQTSMQRFTICFFSKHLPNLNYDELGKTLRDAGFDGVDLTVRPKGHVLPERAAQDLPRAVEVIRSHGLEVPMITTELTSASDPSARTILSTAARLKIPFFKLGYWPYGDSPEESVGRATAGARGLAELAKEFGITAGFHNHPRNVGLCGWDGRAVLRDLDPQWIGCYYDASNATEEGAVKGWEVTLRLALPRLKMAAFKDFYWAKVRGKWKSVPCPLGQGMVDWDKVFPLLATIHFRGPISVHQEYQPPDRMAAAREDLEFVRKHLEAAEGG